MSEMENPDIAAIRNSYGALALGHMQYIRDELLADDVVFHVPGNGSLTGEYQGKDAVMAYLAKVAGAGSLRMEPSSYLLGDHHIAVVLDVTGERDGLRLHERGMQLFRLSGGKICERWSYPPESYASDAFFS